MKDNDLLMIILAFVFGYMLQGMMKNMCGLRLVEGVTNSLSIPCDNNQGVECDTCVADSDTFTNRMAKANGILSETNRIIKTLNDSDSMDDFKKKSNDRIKVLQQPFYELKTAIHQNLTIVDNIMNLSAEELMPLILQNKTIMEKDIKNSDGGNLPNFELTPSYVACDETDRQCKCSI